MPPCACFTLVAVLLQVVDEFAQVVGRKILARDDDGRRMRGEADRLEIARGVVFQVRVSTGAETCDPMLPASSV